MHIFNPSTHEVEVEGSLWIWSQLGLHREFQASQGCTVIPSQINKKQITVLIQESNPETIGGTYLKKWKEGGTTKGWGQILKGWNSY